MNSTSNKVKKQFVKEFLHFSLSTAAVNASKLLTSIFVADLSGPVNFATWNILQPILLYGSIISLGVPNAMNRYVPMLTGASRKQQADDWIRFAFWFTVSACMAASFLLIAISFFDHFLPFSSNCLLFMSFLFFAYNIYNFFLFVLKSRVQFDLMSLQLILFAVVWPIACVVLTWVWGVNGYIIAQFLVYTTISVWIYCRSGVTLTRPSTFTLFRPATVVGFPIMLAGLLLSLMLTVDRWIILQWLGIEAVGHYTVAILVQTTLTILPQVISQQFYPRMAESYGQTRSIRLLRVPVFKQSVVSLGVTLPLLFAVYLTLPATVSWILPEFSTGVEPARIILLGVAFMPITLGIANFFNIIGKQMYYLLAQAFTLGVNVFLSIWFIERGMGLEGVALAGSLSWISFTVFMLIAFLTTIRGSGNIIALKSLSKT